MSLSTDVLAKSTPTRLICRGGRWVLELTRLEAVDRDVFQPKLQRLEGPDSILAALRRSDDGQALATGAAQLMRAAKAEEDRAFEVNEGDWVASAELPPTARAAEVTSEVAELTRSLNDLRAEMVVLRASHGRLRERVMALEASQSGLPGAPPRMPRGSRSLRRKSETPPAPVVRQPELIPAPTFASTQASPGVATPQALDAVQAAAVPTAVAAPQTFEELARALSDEAPQPPLHIPALASLNECLGTLIDGAPALHAKAKESPFATLVSPFGSKLLDDEGHECGAIVVDLAAAVLLGAALLSLPESEARRQVTENDPSEDALLAMSEICNNLTGPVNAANESRHVRATALAAIDVAALPKPRSRTDLSVDSGVLILAMF